MFLSTTKNVGRVASFIAGGSAVTLSASAFYSPLDSNSVSPSGIGLSSLASRLLLYPLFESAGHRTSRAGLLPTLEEDLERTVSEAFGGNGGGGGSNKGSWGGNSHPSISSKAQTPPVIPGAGEQVIFRLIAANTLIYFAWQFPAASVQRIMERWFVTSPVVFRANRTRGIASLLLCTYSHSSFFHLLANMAGLYSFGPRIMQWRSSQQTPRLTPGEFMTMYTISGVFSSLASNVFMLKLGNPRPSLGASGAIFGVLTYYTLAQPESRVLLLFIFNMRSIDALFVATAMNAVLCAQEVRAARNGVRGPLFDGMAHLGGTAVGAVCYYLARERSRARGEGSGSGGSQGFARRSMRGGAEGHAATEI